MLLVEDDDGDALLVAEALADAAPELVPTRVGTLAAALDALPGPYACVLLDLGLPDTSGLEGLRAILERAPDVAVVVLTGRADEQLGIEALGGGAQDYLVKGQAEPDALARALRYATERRRAERSERALLEEQLLTRENARLERGLLPRALISDPRLQLACDYRPGRRRAVIGGDFYDAVELPDGAVHAMVGDVAGHGADEAALGACMRIGWRALTLAGHPPAEVLATLHEMLPHESHGEGDFATVCSVAVAPDRRAATVRLAGHPPPILIDADGRARQLEPPDGAPPLGLYQHGEWPGEETPLEPPWSLLVYTDGLIEGRAGCGERLGEQRLVEMVERHAAEASGWRGQGSRLVEPLIGEAERLNGGPLSDDVAVVLLSAAGG